MMHGSSVVVWREGDAGVFQITPIYTGWQLRSLPPFVGFTSFVQAVKFLEDFWFADFGFTFFFDFRAARSVGNRVFW